MALTRSLTAIFSGAFILSTRTPHCSLYRNFKFSPKRLSLLQMFLPLSLVLSRTRKEPTLFPGRRSSSSAFWRSTPSNSQLTDQKTRSELRKISFTWTHNIKIYYYHFLLALLKQRYFNRETLSFPLPFIIKEQFVITHGTLLPRGCWVCSSPSPFGQSALSTNKPPWPPNKGKEELTTDLSLWPLLYTSNLEPVTHAPFFFFYFLVLVSKCVHVYIEKLYCFLKEVGQSVIVLCNDSELVPHSVDGLADFRGGVVLEHDHHVVLWTCQEQYLQRLQTHPNADARPSWFVNVQKCSKTGRQSLD